MIRRPPRSTLDRSSAASDVYKRQLKPYLEAGDIIIDGGNSYFTDTDRRVASLAVDGILSLIHISEPTRPY